MKSVENGSEGLKRNHYLQFLILTPGFFSFLVIKFAEQQKMVTVRSSERVLLFINTMNSSIKTKVHCKI